MARILSLFPSALNAASRGLSSAAWQREARAMGLGARSSEMAQLFKIAVGVVTAAPQEPFARQDIAPDINSLVPWPTKKATGIRQNVTLTYRDRTTGQIKQTFWSTIGDNPLTREEAVATAIDAYSEHAESYEQDLIGAVHTSAYRMTPSLFQLWDVRRTGSSLTTRNACPPVWWHSTRKPRALMKVIRKYRHGASVVLFAGGPTPALVTTKKRVYLKVQRNSGHGYLSTAVRVRVRWYGRITSDMTFGLAACSRYYRCSVSISNGVISTVIFLPQHGDQITVHSSWLIHGHGYRFR